MNILSQKLYIQSYSSTKNQSMPADEPLTINNK